MALIKCPECNNMISEMAESCPHCGYPLWKKDSGIEEQKLPTKSSTFEINNVQFDIEELKSKSFIKTVAYIAGKVKALCKCDLDTAEEVVYGYFLSKNGEYIENHDELKEKIKFIKSFNGKRLYCPYCLSRNIDIQKTVSESTSKGKSEVRKKSLLTRAGNDVGRAGMIMMTGGLWALTPKKSKYEEVNKGKTKYNTVTKKICMNCGREII